MRLAPHADRIAELWRYYSAGLVNTAFGYGLYALLIWLHVNIFVAQIIAHVCGAAFNYMMFRLHVFRGQQANLASYVGTYAFSYVLNLAILAGFHRIIRSDYLAGFLTVVVVSVLNYFILKRFVFRSRSPSSES